MILCLIVSQPALAVGLFSLDGDARTSLQEKDDPSAEIHVIGISLRKTFSDRAGDRWMLSGLLEFQDDLSETVIHDAYVRYKGPMGRWNITAGRFQLPFSLLSRFSTSRLLYHTLSDSSVGIHSDGGLMVSGVTGDLDYTFAITQGLGVHDDPEFESLELFSGRVGWTYGTMGDIIMGVSVLAGESPSLHHHDAETDSGMHGGASTKKRILGLDGTIVSGLWITRWEAQAGTMDGDPFGGGFVAADYGVFPRVDVTGAAGLTHFAGETTGTIYLGLGYRSPWFTIRGGYTYDISKTDDTHGFTVQLYRALSFPF